MTCIDFHGISIALKFEPEVQSPLHAILSHHPASKSSPDLTIQVHRARGNQDTPFDLRSFRQTFHHGAKGFERDGEFLLWDDPSSVRVSKSGNQIDAEITENTAGETILFIGFSIALRHHGFFHLHAGGVVCSSGLRALVLGESGAGKSTLTWSLLENGGAYLGDDAIFLKEQASNPLFLGIPKPFHLGKEAQMAFECKPDGPLLHSGKHEVTHRLVPGKFQSSMETPNVLLFPRIVKEEKSSLTSIDVAEAFGRALHSSALGVVDGMPNVKMQLDLLKKVVEQSHSYEVQLGSDWLSDVRARQELIQQCR